MMRCLVAMPLLLLPPATIANPGAVVTVRAPDAFYDPPPERPEKPGALVASEPLAGVSLPSGLRAWRIAYTTTIDDDTPAFAVATVFAPAVLPAGPRPVITWTHGTTGLGQACMPSLLSAPAEGIPAVDAVVKNGWVIVATDYSFAEKGGPHPYLIGEGEARAALDATRAARRMGLPLDERTVVWGHSQGGHAALWTGITGPRYAPDVKIIGVAAIAPAADIRRILAMNPGADKLLGPYVAGAYARFYGDVAFEDAVRPEALAAARDIAAICAFVPPENALLIAAAAASFEGRTLNIGSNPALAARLDENAANGEIAAPVVIAQGRRDVVVPPSATDAFVAARCAAGQDTEYWSFAEFDHSTIVEPGSTLDAPLAEWTAARFAGSPAAPDCLRRDR